MNNKARYVFVLGSYESDINPIVVPTNLKNKIHRNVMIWVIKQLVIGKRNEPGHVYIHIEGGAWHKLCDVDEFIELYMRESENNNDCSE